MSVDRRGCFYNPNATRESRDDLIAETPSQRLTRQIAARYRYEPPARTFPQADMTQLRLRQSLASRTLKA